MRVTKILKEIDWQRLRKGDTVQVTTTKGYCFKTHVDLVHGVPIFRDGKGRFFLRHQIDELVAIFNQF